MLFQAIPKLSKILNFRIHERNLAIFRPLFPEVHGESQFILIILNLFEFCVKNST